MPFISRPAAGQIIDPAWGTLVADAVVMRFTTAAQRTSQLVAPVLNQLTTLDSRPGVIQFWTGTAWVDVAIPVERYALSDPNWSLNTVGTRTGTMLTFTSPPYPTRMFLNGTGFMLGSGTGSGLVELFVGGSGTNPAPTTAPHTGVSQPVGQGTWPFTAYWDNVPASTAVVIGITYNYTSGTATVALRDTIVDVRSVPI